MMNTATASAQILQRISSLPPLPAAIGRLLRLVNEPDVEFKEIAKTISLDQTLTAQLLRIANSAFYGFSHQIRTVQQATVILGRHAVRNMALSLAMITLRNRMQTSWPLTPEAFWRHSMGVACGARQTACSLAKRRPAAKQSSGGSARDARGAPSGMSKRDSAWPPVTATMRPTRTNSPSAAGIAAVGALMFIVGHSVGQKRGMRRNA